MTPFQQFVHDNSRWFAGRGRETEDRLAHAESTLGVVIPPDVRWLLTNFGYWHATGISSLEDTIDDTLAAREHLDLLPSLIVLYNHHDGGGILLDTVPDSITGEFKVYNVAWEAVSDLANEALVFPSYYEYVRHQLSLKRDFIDTEHIDYNPDDYRD